jgi:hypothetical protein
VKKIVVNADRGLEAQLNQVFGQVEQRLAVLEAGPFAGGRTITAVKLPVGASTSIEHGLGRAFKGWWPTRIYRGSMTTWLLSEGNSPRPTEAIVLANGCDADVTIDLFVF